MYNSLFISISLNAVEHNNIVSVAYVWRIGGKYRLEIIRDRFYSVIFLCEFAVTLFLAPIPILPVRRFGMVFLVNLLCHVGT